MEYPALDIFKHSYIVFSVSQTEEDSAAVSIPSSSSWQDSVSERPPYSYMAMIQFAINSTERKRMTLKDIYTWIEDHFPYFKHVAKPGWKVISRPWSSIGPQGDTIVSLSVENEKFFFPACRASLKLIWNPTSNILSFQLLHMLFFLSFFSFHLSKMVGCLITEVGMRILGVKRITDLMVDLAGFAVNRKVHFGLWNGISLSGQSHLR